MKWLRFIKAKKQEPMVQIEEKSNNENMDFTDTMFSDIAEMKLKLENIKTEQETYEDLKALIDDFERYVEKASELMEERKIEDKLQRIKESNIILELNPNPEIPQSVKDRVAQELTIEDYYKNIKAVYDVKYKRATQVILMKKLEKFNNDMDKLILGQNDREKISKSDLEEYFRILSQKKEEFVGIMQNKYIEKLIELEYKIKIIELIECNNIYNYNALLEEFIEKAQSTKARQTIWSRLLVIGIQDFIEKTDNYHVQELKKYLEKINLKDQQEGILKEDLIKEYTSAIAKMQQEKEEQEKEEQEKEEQERKAELEQFKDLTEQEIIKKIEELDDDKFDIVTSYKNIIEYQVKVARAKGLINERNILLTDDIVIKRIARGAIPIVLENEKEEVCNCEIYTDIDNSKNNVYVVIPKNVKSDITERPNINPKDFDTRYIGCSHFKATQNFTSIFAKYAENKDLMFIEEEDIWYYYNKETIEKEIKKFIKKIEKENEDNITKIKFYIEIPYRRTIIPILEELKQNGIEFIIPPIDEETKMNEPTVRIYMDRRDLETYKEEVHKKISTSEKGIIKIGEEKVDLVGILIDGCDFPFLKEKDKEK